MTINTKDEDSRPIQEGVEHGPWLPLDEEVRVERAREIFKTIGFLPEVDDPLLEEEHQLKEHLESVREAAESDYWDNDKYELHDTIRDRLRGIKDLYAQRAEEPGYKVDPERMFELFDRNQQNFATGLLDYVFDLKDRRFANDLNRAYYGRTDSRTYLEDELSQPVFDYVADRISQAYDEELEVRHDLVTDDNHEARLEQAHLSSFETAFERYDKLINFTGYGPRDETFLRVYMPIRNIFRGAATIAIRQGDSELLEKWQDRWFDFIRGHDELIADYDGEYQTRQELYFEFREHPERQDIWQEAERGVQLEDSYGEIYRFMGDIDKIPAAVLIDLARRIRNALPEDYWSIMAETSPTGQSWVETLPQISQESSKHGIRAFVDMLVTDDAHLSAQDSVKWDTAVEVGAKDGAVTEWLSFDGVVAHPQKKGFYRVGRPIANRFIVMEPNAALLGVARGNMEDRSNVEFKQNDVSHLELEDESADVVLGDKVLLTLDSQKTRDFFSELGRLLKHGGIFIDGTRPQDLAKIDKMVSNRWKNLLAQMIVDTVTGATVQRDSLAPEDLDELANQSGFTKYSYRMTDWGTTVNVYVKGSKIEDIGYHAVPGQGVKHLLKVTDSSEN